MGSKFDTYAPQMIADLIADFGLKDFQAAGFPGNGGAESAGFTDIVEDGALAKGWAGGTGWFQFTGAGTPERPGRRRQFENWIHRNGWTADGYRGNYSFMVRELMTTERAALAAVRQAASLDEATRAVCWRYERPARATANVAARIRWAQRALQAYRANPPKPSPFTRGAATAALAKEITPMPPVAIEPVTVPVAFPDPTPKNPLMSRRVVGPVATVLAMAGAIFLPQLGAINPNDLTETLLKVGGAAGAILGLWGSWKASRPLAGSKAAADLQQIAQSKANLAKTAKELSAENATLREAAASPVGFMSGQAPDTLGSALGSPSDVSPHMGDIKFFDLLDQIPLVVQRLADVADQAKPAIEAFKRFSPIIGMFVPGLAQVDGMLKTAQPGIDAVQKLIREAQAAGVDPHRPLTEQQPAVPQP